MKRAVITGMGIVSCLGNNLAEVEAALREGKSGIRFNESYREAGLKSHVSGRPDIDLSEHVDRRDLRFMGEGAAFAHVSMQQAIAHAQVDEATLKSERTGIIMGSGGASTSNVVEAADIARSRGVKRIGPYRVTRTMNSSVSACLATSFGIRGVNYSITSACATAAHCLGHAWELIQLGKQDLLFVGAGEEEHWSLAMLFDAMGALSTAHNDTPESASRPYCATRDGFVIAGGGATLVVEELEHALRRGAPIIAEIVGYGASSDGADMVAPSGEGAVRCMKQALATVEQPIDYLNTHGTSTPAGDYIELAAVREAFGDKLPKISSTKSLTGHSLGVAGGHEAIFSLLMLQGQFIAPSAHVQELEAGAEGVPLVLAPEQNVHLRTVMSNSFGFGGTNATLVFAQYDA